MEQLFAQLCAYMNLTYGFNGSACSSSFNAMYQGSKEQGEINSTQQHYQKIFEEDLYSVVDKKYVYTGVGIGAIVNAYNTKQVQLTTPFKPICEELSLNLNENNQSYTLGLRWKW